MEMREESGRGEERRGTKKEEERRQERRSGWSKREQSGEEKSGDEGLRRWKRTGGRRGTAGGGVKGSRVEMSGDAKRRRRCKRREKEGKEEER